MFEVNSDNCGHIVEFKGLFFVGFKAAFLEYGRVDIINEFWCGEHDVDITLHP